MLLLLQNKTKGKERKAGVVERGMLVLLAGCWGIGRRPDSRSGQRGVESWGLPVANACFVCDYATITTWDGDKYMPWLLQQPRRIRARGLTDAPKDKPGTHPLTLPETPAMMEAPRCSPRAGGSPLAILVGIP